MSQPLRKILIVGGGTAGWMTACALNRALGHSDCAIELIESDAIGTVGVGEATVPTIRQFNQDVGLDEVEFIRKTNGSFKLGIEFADWRAPGTRFFHGFGDYVINEGPYSTLNQWLACTDEGAPNAAAIGDLDRYHTAAVMAYAHRFAAPDTDRRSPLAHFAYAFHFDASLYAKLLRTTSEARGVKRHEGRIQGVNRNGETGHIESMTLEDGRVLEADLFVDCSGFIALLADKALSIPYLDYSHWLPVDRAWAVPCASAGPLLPYTRATAREAGWQWRIPLQHRTGNGYVFSSQFISEDAARETLLKNLDGKALDEPRLIRFKTGRREVFWSHNCVAIGLSSGFIEPLESTSISLIQSGINRLINLLPDRDFRPALAKEYNRLQALEFDRIRDFIIMHYCLSGRTDSEFWDYVRHMPLPDTLAYKLQTFRETGNIPLLDQETFVTPSWQALLIGLGVRPIHRDAVLGTRPLREIHEGLVMRAKSIEAAVARLPTQQQFIDRFCAADRSVVA